MERKAIGRLLLLAMISVLTMQCRVYKQAVFVSSVAEDSIVRFDLDTNSGTIKKLAVAVKGVRAGFLTMHPTLPILYAISADDEMAKKKNGKNGAVVAYSVDRQTGALKELSKIAANDIGSTHILVAPNQKYLVTCFYSGDGTTLIPLKPDGTFGSKLSKIAHSGSSVHPKRQKRHHPHGVAISNDNRFVFVADLGNDHVEVYRVENNRELTEASRWKAKPGAGPRHVTLHPNGRWLYCINELDSTISVLNVDAQTGHLELVQNVSTLPKNFAGSNTTAEVVIHPNGKFLYGSNRGDESTAVFLIDQKTGKLAFMQREPTGGRHPRAVALDPTGQVYLAANKNSDNVRVFIVDQKTGKLTFSGGMVAVTKPMSIAFFPIHE